MIRILSFLLMLHFFGALAQQDTTRSADPNYLKVSELKSRINAVLNTPTERDTLLNQYAELASKLSIIESRLDSLIRAMTVVEEPDSTAESIHLDGYYIVVEAQWKDSDTKLSLQSRAQLPDADLSIVQSLSGNWYYIIINEPLMPEEVQPRLRDVRNRITNAWYIRADEIQFLK